MLNTNTLMNMSNSTTTTNHILMPTVRNLQESREICHNFSSVLTAGPSLSEVKDFKHPDHKVVTFDDITNASWGHAPTFANVREMVSWGHGRENLLVHCHAGISRSTATAWGIAISNGFNEEEAFRTLRDNHPMTSNRSWWGGKHGDTVLYKRTFSPNELIVEHLETLFGFKSGQLKKILFSSYNDEDSIFFE